MNFATGKAEGAVDTECVSGAAGRLARLRGRAGSRLFRPRPQPERAAEGRPAQPWRPATSCFRLRRAAQFPGRQHGRAAPQPLPRRARHQDRRRGEPARVRGRRRLHLAAQAVVVRLRQRALHHPPQRADDRVRPPQRVQGARWRPSCCAGSTKSRATSWSCFCPKTSTR